jgi:hypothetical protein
MTTARLPDRAGGRGSQHRPRRICSASVATRATDGTAPVQLPSAPRVRRGAEAHPAARWPSCGLVLQLAATAESLRGRDRLTRAVGAERGLHAEAPYVLQPAERFGSRESRDESPSCYGQNTIDERRRPGSSYVYEDGTLGGGSTGVGLRVEQRRTTGFRVRRNLGTDLCERVRLGLAFCRK